MLNSVLNPIGTPTKIGQIGMHVCLKIELGLRITKEEHLNSQFIAA